MSELQAEDLRVETFNNGSFAPALAMKITHLPTGHVVERRHDEWNRESQLEMKSRLLEELRLEVFPEEEQVETRYGWVVRNNDGQSWSLLSYRWKVKRDAVNEAPHWRHHWQQCKTVKVVTRYKMADDQKRDVVEETWRVISE